MLSEVETSPAMQEKMKVAFAEGYLASDKKKADPEASWSALPRRILRFALIIVTIWLCFQLLQTYSALGGSKFFSVHRSCCLHIYIASVLSLLIISSRVKPILASGTWYHPIPPALVWYQ